MYDQNCSPLAGMTRDQLLAALKLAQDAYIELMTGSKGVSYSYTQGDGTRSVTYTKANLADLNVFIGQLKQALGMCGCPVRRSSRFRYSGW